MGELALMPTHVIDSMNRFIKARYPFIKNITFDPQAGYETTIGQLRVTQSMSGADKLKRDSLPLLSWNRSVLTKSGSGRPIKTSIKDSNDSWVDVSASVASFRYQFILMASNMVDIEKFELDYNARTGINKITDAVVSIPGLGDFVFSIIWEPNLDDIVFNLENNYYKALSGSALVSGTFLSAIATDPAKLRTLIEEIDVSIKTHEGAVIRDYFKITPEV
jgi:hypothetical protein